MNSLKGKTAVVTGGTSGIGAACAKRLADAGARVVIVGRNESKGKTLEEEIRQSGGESVFLCADISDDNSIIELEKQVTARYGQIDILFNNAGIFPVSPVLEEFERESCNTVFDTNISSMIMVTKAFLPHIVSTKGTVLNNASIAGLQNFASGQSYAYAASKSAVIQFTKMMAKRYGKDFRTNCICPGIIETPLYQNFDESKFSSRIPLGRVGTPDDIAKVVNFLVSDDAAYMNGSVIVIDGGITL